jgi:hypothetical protein
MLTNLARNPEALRRRALWLSVTSILPHLLCCMLPTVAALMSLGTTLGLAATLADNPLYRLVDQYHTQLLLVAVLSVAVSGVLNFVSWRVDCRTNGHCHHPPCAPKKRAAQRVFIVSCLLLVLDVSWYVTEEYVLGLHHHAEHGEEVADHAGH